ncbi:hypothetical protein D3C79_709540 [compost metagenome]
MFLGRGQAELAIGVGELGEPGVGQQRAVAEDFVENIRFLQVVELFFGANESCYRKALAGQQFKKGLEGDQRRHAGDLPAGGGAQHFIDFTQLWDAVVRQAQLFDAVQVLLARAALDHFQLAGNQGIPHRVFLLRVVNKPLRIGLASHVLRLFHTALLLRAFFVM